MGKPHMRFVQVSDKEDFIYWCEIDQNNSSKKKQDLSQEVSSQENPLAWSIFNKTKIKFIRIEDILDVKVGYNASAVLKRHKLPIEFDDLIFSIQTPMRTLDLQANSSEIRNRWVKFLKLILSDLEKKVQEEEMSKQAQNLERSQRIKWDLEELWEQEIISNFSAHWDYKNHRPKKTSHRSSNLSGGYRKSPESFP
jgi:hypothetical protein